jgi:hypothetical protein
VHSALFQIANVAVTPFWLLMIVLPRWQGTRRLLSTPLVVAPWLVLYVVLIVPELPGLLPLLVAPTLQDIANVLGTPEGALVGWVHYLAFDLFVGRWVYLDSRQREANVFLMAPVLVLALMFGPAGLLVYLGLRGALGRKGDPGAIC